MSAEEMLGNVLLEIGLDDPSAQIGGTSYEIRQIRGMMNAAGRDVAARAEWSRLHRDWTVAGGVRAAALPADFQEMTETGAVRLDKPGFHPVRAVVAPEQWAFLCARPSSRPFYHLSEGKILFSPALDRAGARIRYVSRHWVAGGRAGIAQNADTLLIPERLVEKGAIWRWKRQKGLPHDDVLAEFEADLIAEIKADRGDG